MRGVVVAGALLVSSGARAEVTVTRSDEVPIADRLVCPAEVADWGMAVGPSGGALIAWTDYRYYSAGTLAIMAARIDGTGVSLDPFGIYLGPGEIGQPPTGGYDGSQYLVAWATGDGVFAARVSGDGVALDASPIVLSASGTYPSVAGSPGQFLVSWRENGQLRAVRIASGAALDATPFVVGAGPRGLHPHASIFDGTNYVLVWNGTGVQAARVSTAGAVIAPGEVDLVDTIIGFEPKPAVAFSGSDYMVAYTQFGTNSLLVTSALAPSGEPQDPFGGAGAPSIAFDGTRYTIAVEEFGGVSLVRMSATNTYQEITSYGLPGSAGYGEAQIHHNGSRLLLGMTSDHVVLGARIENDGTITDPTPRPWSQTSNDQTIPSVAFDGTSEYLAAWLDARDIGHETGVYVGRLATTGGLDGTGIRVGRGRTAAIARPRTAGSTAMVVWFDNDLPETLRATRLSATGERLDVDDIVVVPMGADVEQDHDAIDLACTATTCLVTWVDNQFDVWGSRISLTGTLIDETPIDLGRGASPRVTATDTGFVVGGGRFHIIPEEGEPTPIELYLFAQYDGWGLDWNGSHFLQVVSYINMDGELTLAAARFDRSATQVGEVFDIAVPVGGSARVNVTNDGTNWIVVWSPIFDFGMWDTLGVARISPDGVLLDPGGVELSMGRGTRAIAGTNVEGTFALVRAVTAELPPDRGTRAVASWISITGTNPGADGDGEDGASEGGCCHTGSGPSGSSVLALLGVVALLRRRHFRA